jgi:hypothetical protein
VAQEKEGFFVARKNGARILRAALLRMTTLAGVGDIGTWR